MSLHSQRRFETLERTSNQAPGWYKFVMKDFYGNVPRYDSGEKGYFYVTEEAKKALQRISEDIGSALSEVREFGAETRFLMWPIAHRTILICNASSFCVL